MTIDVVRFRADFRDLTGHSPFLWQERLFAQLVGGQLPSAVDLPTGLGKTAFIALWLIARGHGAPLPRRLVYVVDRRAVVDQATAFATTLKENLEGQSQNAKLKTALGLGERSLPISTLRGQFIDNKEWLEDPASPAIVVGTVDMIGSRLLFEGYGISRKMRPYHAGLLGADSLVVLDEAHLVPPFEKLLEAIESDSARCGPHSEGDKSIIPPLRLLSLSATGRERSGTVFRLQGSLDAPLGERGDLEDDEVARRLGAPKAVTLLQSDSENLEESLADQAWSLAKQGQASIRCIIFCNSRDKTEKTKKLIEDRAGGSVDTELFVGARRIRERQDAARRLTDLGFIAGTLAQSTRPAFLFATSAAEVGVDLDADHVVCDLVAWERMVQRLGRVNRRGNGDSEIHVVFEPAPSPSKATRTALEKPEELRTKTETKAVAAHEAERKCLHAFRKPFEHVLQRRNDGKLDASPGALRALKERASRDSRIAEIIKDATTPMPLRPALTRALVDAWSMTSLEQHTGRPEVQPWLRGWVDDEPQTSVVWRKHLPVRCSGSGTKGEIEDFFEAAPVHSSERLDAETYHVEKWLLARCVALIKSIERTKATRGDAEPKLSHEATAADETRERDSASEPLRKTDMIALLISGAGELRGTLRLNDFAGLDEKRKATELDRKLEHLAGAVLVVDARLGGLTPDGLLDSACDTVATCVDNCEEWLAPLPSAAQPGTVPEPVVKFRVRLLSADQSHEADGEWLERYRFATERDSEGADTEWLMVEKWRDDSENEADRSESRNPQLLAEHQSWTEEKARSLGQRLGLTREWVEVIATAARLHDEGKRTSRWQRAFNAPTNQGPYAKTNGPINLALLDGYRHEFGSLRWVEDDQAFQCLPADARDLVLHLIAAHHGQARPVIGTRSCEDAPPSVLQQRAQGIVMRFARLQKRWGPWGLAWWESLLRAADQQASRANDKLRAKETR